MFQLIADSVIVESTLPCRFDIPVAPNGEDIDPTSVEISIRPKMGAARKIRPVTSCGNGDGLFVDGTAGQVVLCPATCEALTSDGDPDVEIRWGCNLNIR